MRPVIAVLPAAGGATRLGDLVRGDKAALPVWQTSAGVRAPAAVCALSALWDAGVREARLVVRERAKPAEAADQVLRLETELGSEFVPDDQREGVRERTASARPGVADTAAVRDPMRLHYLSTPPTPSAVHSVALALRDEPAGRSDVALAFPDILFRPRSAFAELHFAWRSGQWDVLLGCLPSHRPEKTDMVEFDGRGELLRLVIKQPDQGLTYTWQMAVWSPRFTRRLIQAAGEQETIRGPHGSTQKPQRRGELHVGELIHRASREGLRVGCVPFPDGACLDIGTPEDLARASQFSPTDSESRQL